MAELMTIEERDGGLFITKNTGTANDVGANLVGLKGQVSGRVLHDDAGAVSGVEILLNQCGYTLPSVRHDWRTGD